MKKLDIDKTHFLSYIGLLTTLALIFSYIESLLPIPIPIPGIKLGLSNIIILFSIYYFDYRYAIIIGLLKVVIQALLFGTPLSFTLSLSGLILSLIIISLLYKQKSFSIVFISIMGGVFHNTGQIIAASVIMGKSILVYYPILIVSGVITGLIVGIITKFILKRINPYRRNADK